MADKVNEMPGQGPDKVEVPKKGEDKIADSVGPVSLRELYEIERANPQKFLSGVAKLGGSPFELTDQDAALEILMTADPDLIVTTNLMYRSQKFSSGKFSYSCARFAERVIRMWAKELGEPLPENETPAAEIYAVLCKLASRHFKEKDRKKWALNMVAIGAMWLSVTKRLGFEEALKPIEKLVLPGSTRAKTLLQAEETAFEMLTRPPVNTTNIKKLIQFSKAWETGKEKALDDARSANVALQNTRSEVEALKTKVNTLEDEVQSLRSEILRQKASYEDSLKHNQGERINVQHDLGGVRSRLQSALVNKIKGPIDIALEAIDVDPPRVRVIEQELNTALDTIEKEIKWLKSSD